MNTTPCAVNDCFIPIDEAFFPVESRPLYMNSPELIDYKELPRHFAIVDCEEDKVFAVVTDDYDLVTNKQAYDEAEEIMRSIFRFTNLSDLKCFNITMPKTRSFCHIDLVHKGADFSPWEDDKWTAFLRITNSYNRTRLLKYELGFCRWICKNGMIFGSKSIEYSYSHSRRGKNSIKQFSENIGDIRALEAQLADKLKQLKRFDVPKELVLPLACRTFQIKATEETLSKEKSISKLIEIREHIRDLSDNYYTEMGPHGYTAMNVLTDFATRPRGFIASENRIHSLQQKCGDWVDDFVTSIQAPDFSFDKYLGEYKESAQLIESLG